MPSITYLRTAIAALLQHPAADFVSGGVDLLLLGINSAKRQLQLDYDFELCRTQGSVSVNLTTGGSFAAIVDGESASLAVKKIETAYIGYTDAQRPIEFVSRASQVGTLTRAYESTDWAPANASPLPDSGAALPKLVQRGDGLYLFPDQTNVFAPATSTTVYLDVVKFFPDYVATQTATVSGASAPSAVNAAFAESGTYNGKRLWVLAGGTPYAIWHNGTIWVISTVANIGVTLTNYFSLTSTSDNPTGTYAPHGSFTGTPALVLADATSGSDFFLTQGFDALLWKTVCDYNYLWQTFVPRQEGVLGPPTALRDKAIQDLHTWDAGLVGSGSTAVTLD